MKSLPRLALLGALGGTALAFTLGGNMGHAADRPTDPLAFAEDLQQALEGVAKKHGMSVEEVYQKAVEQRVAGRLWAKGRQALVAPDLYVETQSASNTLQIQGGAPWKGAPLHGPPELVVVSGKKVLGALQLPKDARPQDATFLWFGEDRVHVLEGARLRGGYVKRHAPTPQSGEDTPPKR